MKSLGESDETPPESTDQLNEDIAFITTCNTGGEFMEDVDIDRLKQIAAKQVRLDGEEVPASSEDEVMNLSIRKGTLTNNERDVISNHAAVSIKVLSQLPFLKSLSRVAEYAGGHHEKLNGEGYPHGLKGDQLALQARILAVADVFEP